MIAPGEPRVWLEHFPLNEPQPFACDHHGLRYPGEVIRASRWSPAWGRPLSGDTYFRIVLLQQRRSGTQPAVHDPRIALCLPSTGPSRQRSQVSGELATLRETQAVYFTQPRQVGEADLIRRTLERRQQGLEEDLLEEESARYGSGMVLTHGGESTYATSFFAGTDPVAWFTRIGQWLLARAYPDLPVAAPSLPRPVTPEDPGQLHRAIFAPIGADILSGNRGLSAHPGDSRAALDELGPGLHLSILERPAEYNPSHCPVFDLIRSWLSSRPAPAAWTELHHYLAHQVGLTRPLATLYLLLYLHHAGPEMEVRLSPGHGLVLLGGRPLPGTQLTGGLVPLLQWDPMLSDWAATIGPETRPRWNDALPYLGVLAPRLAPVAEGLSLRGQEQELQQAVVEIARLVAQARELLWLLSPSLGEVVATSPVAELLQRLSGVSGGDFPSVYQAVRSSYPDFRRLEADLDALRQLAQLARHAPAVLAAREYLAAAAAPASMPELSVQRQALLAALSPDGLLWLARSWSLLEQQVSAFKAQYGAAYRSHHHGTHQSLPAYLEDRDTAGRELRALALLNTMPELGEAAGQGLAEALAQLWDGPPSCTLPDDGLPLETAPRCPACGLGLDQGLPAQELARLGAAIAALLAGKNRRLSNLLVERVLQGKTDQRLDDFLKIVQASDLSALSNTLSDELVALLRQILQ